MLDQIFAHDAIKSKVNETHAGIREMFKGLTLEEVLIVGYNWKASKINVVVNDATFLNDLKAFFYSWQYEKTKETLASFRLYDQPAITRHARFRAIYLQDMKRKGYDLSDKQSLPQLEMLSCLGAEYNTVLYAIKCYLLANYTDEEIQTYQGIQPQTGPIYNSVSKLFDCEDTTMDHMKRCTEIAYEIDESTTYVNTALYLMG